MVTSDSFHIDFTCTIQRPSAVSPGVRNAFWVTFSSVSDWSNMDFRFVEIIVSSMFGSKSDHFETATKWVLFSVRMSV